MVLSIQLPFAVIPLLKMTSSSKIMSTKFTNGKLLRFTSIIISVIVILANISLLFIFLLSNINFGTTIGIILFAIFMVIGIFYIGILIWLSTVSVDKTNLIITPKFEDSPNMGNNIQMDDRSEEMGIEIEYEKEKERSIRSQSAPSSLL